MLACWDESRDSDSGDCLCWHQGVDEYPSGEILAFDTMSRAFLSGRGDVKSYRSSGLGFSIRFIIFRVGKQS